MPPYAEDETEAVFWTGTMDWGCSTYVPLPADGASDLKEGLEVRKIPGDVAVVVGLELEFVDPPAVVAAAVTDEELLCPLTLTNPADEPGLDFPSLLLLLSVAADAGRTSMEVSAGSPAALPTGDDGAVASAFEPVAVAADA